MNKLLDIVNFNPIRKVNKGEIVQFVDMSSLPEDARDILNVQNKKYTGGGARFKNGDTLVARITPCLENGKGAKVDGIEGVAFGSTEFIVLEPKNKSVDEDFIYYLTRWKKFKNFAESRLQGTSGRQRVSWQALSDFEYSFPDDDTRKSIGQYLKNYDDQIYINTQENINLELVANKLFSYFFVTFDAVIIKKESIKSGLTNEEASIVALADFVGLVDEENSSKKIDTTKEEIQRKLGDKFEKWFKIFSILPSDTEKVAGSIVPKNWKSCNASELIEFNPKLSIKKGTPSKYVDMRSLPTFGHRIENVIEREYTSGVRFQNNDVLIARITPCLENGKTAFVDCLEGDEIGWGSTEFINMRAKNSVDSLWVYLLSRSPKFVAYAVANMTGTSGRQRVPSEVLAQFTVSLPQDSLLLEVFSDLVTPIFEKIKNNSLENSTLAKIRDLLIPSLFEKGSTINKAEL